MDVILMDSQGHKDRASLRHGQPSVWLKMSHVGSGVFYLFEKKKKQFLYLYELKESQVEKFKKCIHLYEGDFNTLIQYCPAKIYKIL